MASAGSVAIGRESTTDDAPSMESGQRCAFTRGLEPTQSVILSCSPSACGRSSIVATVGAVHSSPGSVAPTDPAKEGKNAFSVESARVIASVADAGIPSSSLPIVEGSGDGTGMRVNDASETQDGDQDVDRPVMNWEAIAGCSDGQRGLRFTQSIYLFFAETYSRSASTLPPSYAEYE